MSELFGLSNKYKYDVITVKISNTGFSETVQNLCFDNGINWVNNSNSYFNFDYKFFYMDICLRDKLLYLNHLKFGENEPLNISYWEKLGYKVDPMIYMEEDFRLISNIVRYGRDIPDYSSRKIVRTLESYDEKSVKKSLIFSVKDKSELEKILIYFHNVHGIESTNTLENLIDSVENLFRYGSDYLVVSYEMNYFFILDLDKISEERNIDRNIYTVNDLDRFNLVPSYKPRKIIRTLESYNMLKEGYIVEGIELEDEFSIKLDSVDDSEKVQKFLFSQEYKWVYYDVGIIRPLVRGNIITCYKSNKDMVWCENEENFNCYIGLGWRNNPKIYTMDQYNEFIRLISDRKLIPSYEPRIIKRTLESMDVKIDKIERPFSIKCSVDMIEKVEKFLIEKTDAWWVSSGKVIFLTHKKDLFRNLTHVYFNLDNNGSLTWSRISASFFKIEINTESDFDKIFVTKPNYEPRRIVRTLESFNGDDATKTKYFTEYNTLVFSIGGGDDIDDFKSFMYLWEKIFEITIAENFINDIIEKISNSIPEPQYVRMSFMFGSFEKGHSELSYFPKYAERYGITYKKIFTFKEIFNHFNTILKTCCIVPSYEPRKIDRTLESTMWYPYRFKTEQEFINEFGENWSAVIMRSGPDWADSMDHLFGQDFPYEDSQLNPRDSRYPVNGRMNDPYAGCDWKIGWDMLISNKPNIPNYEPRKIDRTLESTMWYPYRFKTEQEFIDEFGPDWEEDMMRCGPNWTGEMDHFFGQDFPYKENELNPRDSRYAIIDRMYDPYIGCDWKIGWNMLIPNKPKIPNYEPRKIDRTLESRSIYPYRIKTEQEFIDEFGENWRQTVGLSWVDPMDVYFGMEIEEDIREEDKVKGRELSLFQRDNWSFTWDMITETKPKIPNYNPRKIDRSIDLNEDIKSDENNILNGSLNEHVKLDVTELPYFKKYNVLVMVFDRDVDTSKYDKMVDNFDKILDLGNGFKLNMIGYRRHCDDNKFVYKIDLMHGRIVWGWNNVRDIDHTLSQDDKYPRVFGIDDLDSEIKIIKILHGDDFRKLPSYLPRKIERTFESKNGYPYFLIKFIIKNKEELESIISHFYNEHNIGNNGDRSEESLISLYTNKIIFDKMFFIIDLEYFDFHLIYKEELIKNIPYITSSWVEDLNNEKITDPNIYEFSNLRLIDDMIKKGYWDKLKNLIKPSYEPRKIDRTL